MLKRYFPVFFWDNHLFQSLIHFSFIIYAILILVSISNVYDLRLYLISWKSFTFLTDQNFNSNLMLDEIGIAALGYDKEIDRWTPPARHRWGKENSLTIITTENYTNDDATIVIKFKLV